MPELAHVPFGLRAHLLAVEHPEHRAERARLALLAAEEQVVGDVQRRVQSARVWYTVSIPALRALERAS